MWTRAPSITSCVDCLASDHEEEVGGASSRFHHRGSSRSSSNHQPGGQELQDTRPTASPAAATTTKPEYTATLDYLPTLGSPTTTVHHDLPKPPGSSKRSFSRGRSFVSDAGLEPALMSTPELASVVATRVKQPATQTGSNDDDDVGCVSRTDKPQLDDMQTQISLANAHTPASCDQEVPEVVLPSPSSKRRRLETYPNDEPELNHSPAEARSPEGCEDSGLTGEQHMADPERTSTPEGIDSAAPVTELAAAPVPQCSTVPSPGHQQEIVADPEPLQILEHLHFSSVAGRTSSPRDDDPHYTTSQFLPPAGHIRVPDTRSAQITRTMAGGGDEWLRLSLGSHSQSDDEPPATQSLYQQPPPRTASPDPPGIRDFFKFGVEIPEASSSYRHYAGAAPYGPGQSSPHYAGESSKQHYYQADPRSGGLPPSHPLLRPRTSSRDFDPNVPTPRVLSEQFKDSFTPPQFSNLVSLPYLPARVLQPVRSEQTETTAVHAWRSSAHEAGPSASPSSGPQYSYPPSPSPWMLQQQQQLQFLQQDPQRTSPNPAEFLSVGTRDWREGTRLSSMQAPLAQGVDPEQSWLNLLQRVGNTSNVPSMSSAAPRHPESMPSAEYLDALKRAVERFQGADQGGKEEPLTATFPQPRLPFDPSTDISLARFYGASGSSKPRAQAAGPGPSSQRRILRPYAPRPGLWFTLQASNSQPEASPLQQIPTAYIRVVDDTMTVAVVRRYLANKLGLASEDEVEVTCKGQSLQPSLSLNQVRDSIWQSPNINTPSPNTTQLLSEGKAWKAPDGSITLVGDVVIVLTYGRRPLQQQAPPPTPTPISTPTPTST